ncbi:MAG: hypothetical protein FD181_176 [Prolixibacteraceae bacterium]|nr:MAG: hypothetical protein FD181_176 [Prolixibacteraceae bacterium]
MKLAKYTYDLLLENETVIIPGFGAFVSTYKPAEIGDNEIKPPLKEISFTRQIRNNDGMLVASIARKAKISQTNALKRIEKECENILYQLDKGEKVVVEDLGVLFYNEKNEIRFTPFQEDNLLLDSFGFQPVSMDDIIEEPVVEQKTKPIKLPEYKGEPLIVYHEGRKKVGWYWYFLILIPIFIGGYSIFTKFSKSINKEIHSVPIPQTEKQEIIVQTITPSDSVVNGSIARNEAIETVKTETAENTVSTDTKFYLVGGGFKSEENAEKFIVRLKERGIDGIMIGQKGSLFLVVIGSFNTESKAYNSLNEHVKKYPDWNLWVLEK